MFVVFWILFFFSSRRRHTRFSRDWSSDVCSSDLAHDSDANRKFAEAMKAQAPDALLNYASVGAYDGMHLIHKMVEATDGKKDGDKAIAAIKGYEWESPRGPARIDPESRHITQNVYLRKVERGSDGLLQNTEIENFGMQPDHGLAQ